MIDIAGSVPAGRAVDVDLFIDIENIQTVLVVVRLVGHDLADIFDDLFPLRDRLHRKQPQAGLRAADP